MNLRNKWFAIAGSTIVAGTLVAALGTTLPTAFAQTVTNTNQAVTRPTATETTELKTLRSQLKAQHQTEVQLNQEIRSAIVAWKQTNPLNGLTSSEKTQLQTLRQEQKADAQQLQQLRPQIQKLEEQIEQARSHHDTATLQSLRTERQSLVTKAKGLRQQLQTVRAGIQSLVPASQRQAFHQKAVALKAQTSPIRTNLNAYRSQRKAMWTQIKTDRQAKNWSQLVTDLQRLSVINGDISAAKSQLLNILQQQQA